MIDRKMLMDRQAEARRHVALGERHIAEQEDRITELAANGHDTTESRKLLENFYGLQQQHVQHRDRLLRQLEK
ncbi:hypothetical protein [Bradyrhizobium sp. CCGB20]|uniref:hypothetical protein n=1 Tax=Bradyrhizobium sp. CCGB20 TaxID=2949633 RepID=UPI0020B24567|nr:hypothetical protein [Bradyrhizobium sp. CCGB20]MCP3400198.1 hypothetical protein [Bradyrhizobium sp. CCGB20]